MKVVVAVGAEDDAGAEVDVAPTAVYGCTEAGALAIAGAGAGRCSGRPTGSPVAAAAWEVGLRW